LAQQKSKYEVKIKSRLLLRTQIIFIVFFQHDIIFIVGLGKQRSGFGENKKVTRGLTPLSLFFTLFSVHIQQLDMDVILKVLIQLCFLFTAET